MLARNALRDSLPQEGELIATYAPWANITEMLDRPFVHHPAVIGLVITSCMSCLVCCRALCVLLPISSHPSFLRERVHHALLVSSAMSPNWRFASRVRQARVKVALARVYVSIAKLGGCSQSRHRVPAKTAMLDSIKTTSTP